MKPAPTTPPRSAAVSSEPKPRPEPDEPPLDDVVRGGGAFAELAGAVAVVPVLDGEDVGDEDLADEDLSDEDSGDELVPAEVLAAGVEAAPVAVLDDAALAAPAEPVAPVAPVAPAAPVALPTPALLAGPDAGALAAAVVGAVVLSEDAVVAGLSSAPLTSRALPSIVGGGPERFMIGGAPRGAEPPAADDVSPCPGFVPDGWSLPDGALPLPDDGCPFSDAPFFGPLRSPSPFDAMQLSIPLARFSTDDTCAACRVHCQRGPSLSVN